MNSFVDAVEIICNPNVLAFSDFRSLCRLFILSKNTHLLLQKEGKQHGFWQACCNSFCFEAGLYSPMLIKDDYLDFERHFIDELWGVKRKWGNLQELLNYKIRVSCRFRPGDISTERICLPLHQFLQIKRRQIDDEKRTTAIIVGRKEPEEFLDPILGTIMKDPVRLQTSGRVLDRSVAVQCILRGGRDPFNNKRLTAECLEPQLELIQKIGEWKRENSQQDISVDVKDARSLIDSNPVNQELLTALMELENLKLFMKTSVLNSKKHQTTRNSADAETMMDNVSNVEPETEENNPFTANLDIDFRHLYENVAPNVSANLKSSTNLHNDTIHMSQKDPPRIVDINDQSNFVAMHVPGTGVQSYHFCKVFTSEAKQTEVFDTVVKDSLFSVLNGRNSCVLCYGQTGSGKTHTYIGPKDCLTNSEKENNSRKAEFGIVIQAADELFLAKQVLQKREISLNVGIQFVEVYDEKMTDLLSGKPVNVRRDTGQIVGGDEMICETLDDFISLLQVAQGRQHFAETAMNSRSSRAHSILIFHLSQVFHSVSMGSSKLVLQNQLYLVDLAGSERIKKSKVVGIHKKEAVGINSSLLVLGKVINALAEGKSHIPYFESKLTTILKPAFGGNSKTTVIINGRMDGNYCDETLQSLRFGERCSNISNQLRQLATSVSDTLFALDETLDCVKKQLIDLKEKKKDTLDIFRTLSNSYDQLVFRRSTIAKQSNVSVQ